MSTATYHVVSMNFFGSCSDSAKPSIQSVRRFTNRSGSSNSLKEKGEKYSKATGVELKFDDGSDEDVDLDAVIDLTDLPLLVKRCMLKYPSTVPKELSLKKVKRLLAALPGYRECECSPEVYTEFIKAWDKAYQENLDEIMFKNLASYEP